MATTSQLPNDANTIALWHLDGTAGSVGKKTDSSSAGLTLTEVGSPTATTGQITPTTNGAYALNGSSQYLSSADTGLVTGNSSRSMEAWVNLTVNNVNQVVANYGTRANNENWTWDILTTGKMSVDLFNANANTSSNTAISTGAWHYIAITYDGTTLTYYLDGNADGTSTMSATPNTVLNGNNYLGVNNALTVQFLGGSIDEVRYSNKVRSSTEIFNYYNDITTGTTRDARSLILLGVG